MSKFIAAPMFGVCPWIPTSESFLSPYLTGRRRSPRAPTSAQSLHSARTIAMSVSVMFLRFMAISHSSRLVIIPYLEDDDVGIQADDLVLDVTVQPGDHRDDADDRGDADDDS